MKIQLVLLGALAALALAQNDQSPPMFQMPNLPFPIPNMNMKDIEGALKQLENMSPEMKDRMFSMAKSFGLNTDDLEKKLNENMPQIKQMLQGAEQVVEKVEEKEEDDEDKELADIVSEKLNEMGLPSLTGILPMMKNMLIEQVKAYGIDVDEADPEKTMESIQKKADEIMGIDEEDDPDVREEKYKKAVLKLAKDAGLGIKSDDFEEAAEEINEVLHEKVKEAGLGDIDVTDPEELKEAIMKKVKDMGVPIDKPTELIKMCKQFFRENAMEFLANLNGGQMPQMPQIMSQLMSHMMPQMPRMPPMMPPMRPHEHEDREQVNAGPITLNLDINIDPAEVTAPQTIMMMHPMMRQRMMEQQIMQQPPVPHLSLQEAVAPAVVPTYLKGAESVIMHVPMMGEEDEVAHHIMNLQSGLNNGEIPEEALMELMEDLMHYRLKAKVLMVRNMYLHAQMEALQKQMPMPAPPMPHPVMRPPPQMMPEFLGAGSFGHGMAREEQPTLKTQSPILKALLSRLGL